MHRFRFATAVAALVIVAAGCSSGQKVNNATSTTAPPAAPGQNVAADKALAKAANLTLSDFPAGWTSAPQTNDSSGQTITNQLEQCLHAHLSFLQLGNPTTAQSPQFSDSSGDDASSSVTYLVSTSVADSDMHVFRQANFPSCMTSAVNTVIQNMINNPSSSSGTLPQGASVGTISVNAMSFPSYGDQSVAFRGTIPITYKGFNIDAYIDLVAAQKGRAIVGMDFASVGSGLDPTMEEQLTSDVVQRLTNT